MFRMLFVLALLPLFACAPVTPQPETKPLRTQAPEANGLVLEQVLETVRSHDKHLGKPVVLFDLDDTLFDVRSRTLRIVHEFAAEPEFKKAHPKATERLAHAVLTDIRYLPRDAFAAMGIDDTQVFNAFKTYWDARFFSDKYCAQDEVIPGSPAYVKKLQGLGAHIVYLTGRDAPRMKKGTIAALQKRKFPFGKNTSLFLKPEAVTDDLSFKAGVFESVEKIGKVVAAFENEPRNVNAMGEYFPKAVLVFVDTQHSNAPDSVTLEAHWVKSYIVSPDDYKDSL